MKNKSYRKQEKHNKNVSNKTKEPILPVEDVSKADNNSDDLILFETVAKRGQPLSISDLFKSKIRYWFKT